MVMGRVKKRKCKQIKREGEKGKIIKKNISNYGR